MYSARAARVKSCDVLVIPLLPKRFVVLFMNMQLSSEVLFLLPATLNEQVVEVTSLNLTLTNWAQVSCRFVTTESVILARSVYISRISFKILETSHFFEPRTEKWQKKTHQDCLVIKILFLPANLDKHDSFLWKRRGITHAFSFLNFLPFFDLIITIEP